LAVDETGFHIAMAPSHSGIKLGGVKALEIIPKGKAAANRLPAASWLGVISPRKTPIHIRAKRSRSSRAKSRQCRQQTAVRSPPV